MKTKQQQEGIEGEKIYLIRDLDYRAKYFEQKGFNLFCINDYCSLYKDDIYDFMEKGGYPGFYSKAYFSKKYETHKNKFNNNDIKDCISYCIQSKIIKDNVYLDIYSPFFEALLTTNYFSDIFTIVVSTRFIKQNNLENDYIQAINYINKLNTKYSILFRFFNGNDIDYFDNFKLNLKNIKKLILLEEKDIGKYNYFFEKLFSFNELKNSLKHFKISLRFRIDQILLQDINACKNLEILELDSIHFTSLFTLNLPQLKMLKLSYCSGISLSQQMCSNLIDLYFVDFAPVQERQLKFPKLKICEFYFQKDYMNFNLIFDFTTMKNLKVLKSESEDFLKLGNDILLEDLTVISNRNNPIENEIKIIEKIISMKSLKKVYVSLNKIGHKEISNINGLNESITTFRTELKSHPNFVLYSLQGKLPNISDLDVRVMDYSWFHPGLPVKNMELITITDIDITENMKCKIKNLKIICKHANLKLYCQSFQYLEKIDIYIGNSKNVKDKFPFFKDNCNIIFPSLKFFKFWCDDNIDLKILDNLCNNLEKMNNMKYLWLRLTCKNVDNNYYARLNAKLSNLNLDYININISNGIIYQEPINEGQYEEDKHINQFKENGICIQKFP